MEVWERDNQGLNEEYTGKEYQVSEIRIRKEEDPAPYVYPEYSETPYYSKIDYSNLFVYGRTEIKRIFIPNSLNGWPSTWGGELPIYNRDTTITKIVARSNIAEPVDIAEDTRLYAIVSADAIDTFSYTKGTIIPSASGLTYILTILNEENGNIRAKFKVKRNNNGKIILISLVDGGRDFKVNETIKIVGSQIGGVDITDDVTITVNSIKSKPEFRFISIGDPL